MFVICIFFLLADLELRTSSLILRSCVRFCINQFQKPMWCRCLHQGLNASCSGFTEGCISGNPQAAAFRGSVRGETAWGRREVEKPEAGAAGDAAFGSHLKDVHT